MMYKYLIKPVLSLIGPEAAKTYAFSTLRTLSELPFFRQILSMAYCRKHKNLHTELFGLRFSNPVGVSAGIDQNGDYYDLLSDMGFGFVEIGSLTSDEDKGYPKPRVFRLVRDRAFINRSGIPNKGVSYAIERLQNSSRRNIADRKKCVIIGSIGQNSGSGTDMEIFRNYEQTFSLMYDFVDMVSINISCYDENNVMRLLNSSSLAEIMDPILSRRLSYETYKPIVVKVSSDIHTEELKRIIDYCRLSGVDGIIAGGFARIQGEFNTGDRKLARIGTGVLSGAPVYEKTIEMVKFINAYTKGRFPIIASGGIMSEQQAWEMLEAGASLIQIHSALYYEGPGFVKKTLKYLMRQAQAERNAEA